MACNNCKEIKSIIDSIENRCLATDGPVTNTRIEMTNAELIKIYRLASSSGKIKKEKPITSAASKKRNK
jgi:hypothetical protein